MSIKASLRIFLVLIIAISCNDKKEESPYPADEFIKSGLYLGDYYPSESWRECSPGEVGMDKEKLEACNNEIARLIGMDYEIHSVLVIKEGYIVAEQYYNKYFKKDIEHIIHSCTKSFTSAAVGIAVDKGYLDGVDEKMYEFFPEYQIADFTEAKKSITIRDLLTMSAGLDWHELGLSYSDPQNTFYQWRRVEDRIGFILDRPVVYQPGSTHEYNSGCSDLLSIIVQKTTGMRTDSFASKYLLVPIGIKDYYWAIDPAGHAVGYGQMRMTSRNMARFGYLYLKNGWWEDEQLISEAWIAESRDKQIPVQISPGASYYGYQFWVTDFGMYTAMGYGGQWIMILPDYEMIVVFTNDFEEGDADKWNTPIRLLTDYIIPGVN